MLYVLLNIMSLTENGPTATEDSKVTVEDNIYGDIITEIELGDENVELMADVKSVNPESEPNLEDEPQTQSADITTPSNTILPPDDTVSEFFTVDSKTEVFDNDMIISELDSEGIDFKNDTDVVECHHDYENKKLLFEDEDLVVEDVPAMEEEEEENELRLEEELEVNEPCFEIAADEERYDFFFISSVFCLAIYIYNIHLTIRVNVLLPSFVTYLRVPRRNTLICLHVV